MNLLDLMTAPPIVRPVEPKGHVVQGRAQEVMCWHERSYSAQIELHPQDGLWMWSVCYTLPGGGSGYKVGAKWGRFAACRADALHHAIAELTDKMARREAHEPLAARVLAWAGSLR